jgi:hypothetical protein
MAPLTFRSARETTRKLGGLAVRWRVLTSARLKRLGGKPLHPIALGMLFLTGCATSGPNHVYLTTAGSPAVHDLGPPPAAIPGVITSDEQAVGLAYDFNTDHLFVRVAPAQVIRVIERPSGKVLREMPLPPELLPGTPAAETVSADLAIRSSDRHLFAVHPDGHSVVELTLLGEYVRRIELAGLGARIGGLACDQSTPRLLVLAGSAVRAFSFEGQELGAVSLQGEVRPVSLGYDSDARHYFVPVTDGHALGEFDSTGTLVTTHPGAGPAAITAIDAGPRSFVRVF